MAKYWIDVSTTDQSDDPTPDTYITRYLPSVNHYASQVAAEQDQIKQIQLAIPVDVPIINRYDIPKGLWHATPEGGKSTVGLIGKYS